MMVKTVKEALEAGPGTYVGGGTDLMPLLKNHARTTGPSFSSTRWRS